MENDKFGFECCWTCRRCILDIGIGKYVCNTDNRVLADQNNRGKVCEPTGCNMWNQK